jgi:hypothetical protein
VAYSYLSSRLVREIAQLGASITSFVPPLVEERLRAKILKPQRLKPFLEKPVAAGLKPGPPKRARRGTGTKGE